MSLLEWTADYFCKRDKEDRCNEENFSRFLSAFATVSFTPEEKSQFFSKLYIDRLKTCIEKGLVKEGDILPQHQNKEVATLLEQSFPKEETPCV